MSRAVGEGEDDGRWPWRSARSSTLWAGSTRRTGPIHGSVAAAAPLGSPRHVPGQRRRRRLARPRRRASRSRTRACCAATAASRSCALRRTAVRVGRPPRAAGGHVRRPAAARPTSTPSRRGRSRCSSGPARRRRCCGSWSRAAAAGSRSSSRCPRARRRARVMTVTYAPTRVLNGLKTLSYAGNMLAGRLAQEPGYDEALLVTPHGRVLEGPTWTFFWVAGGAPAHAAAVRRDPRLDHPRAGCSRSSRSPEAPCTLDDVRARRGGLHRLVRARGHADRGGRRHRAASAPGPLTRAAHEAFTQRVVRELAAERAAA